MPEGRRDGASAVRPPRPPTRDGIARRARRPASRPGRVSRRAEVHVKKVASKPSRPAARKPAPSKPRARASAAKVVPAKSREPRSPRARLATRVVRPAEPKPVRPAAVKPRRAAAAVKPPAAHPRPAASTMLMPLHEGIVYGPVRSRRLGRSLGINLTPAHLKLCSFNCSYCQYGWSEHSRRAAEPSFEHWPSARHGGQGRGGGAARPPRPGRSRRPPDARRPRRADDAPEDQGCRGRAAEGPRRTGAGRADRDPVQRQHARQGRCAGGAGRDRRALHEAGCGRHGDAAVGERLASHHRATGRPA